MKNTLSLVLNYMDLDFNCQTLKKGTTLFSLQCEMQCATFKYQLLLRETHTPSVLQFTLQVPLDIPGDKMAEMMLFVTAMNHHNQDEPGHWMLDTATGTLTMVYNWYCNAEDEHFETTFRHLFVKLIADTDDSIESIQAVLNGQIHPEDAATFHSHRNKAWLN
jgi:hypothetical protein